MYTYHQVPESTMETGDERLAILDEGSHRAPLCLSYRLTVWFVLGLGATLSFMSLSTQAAVFTCRRLSKPKLPRTQNAASRDTTAFTSNLTADDDSSTRNYGYSSYHNRTLYSFRKNETLNDTTNRTSGSAGWDGEINVTSVSFGTNVCCGRENGSNAITGNTTDMDLCIGLTKEGQSWVLAATSIGYYVITLPVAILSHRLGACRVCLVSAFICVLTTFVTVPALYGGPVVSAFVCFVKGASAGALYPVLSSLGSVWCGKTETSMMTSLLESGLQVGHAASFLAAAWYCDGQEGWTNVFYTHGLLGAVFIVLFWMIVEDTPATKTKCMSISSDERRFFSSSMKAKGFSNKQTKIPFRSILTSLPVMATVVAQLGSEWIDCLQVANLPHFMSVTHGIGEKMVEILTAAGFLLSIPVALLGARLADWLLDSGHLSPSFVRKMFDVLSKGIPTVCFVLLSSLDSADVTMLAVLYVIASCSIGLTDSAWPANCFDMAPAYAGFLISLGEALTSWMWAVCVLVVAYAAPQDTPEQWQNVMSITAGLLCACVIFYLIFASGEQQIWAVSKPDPDQESS